MKNDTSYGKNPENNVKSYFLQEQINDKKETSAMKHNHLFVLKNSTDGIIILVLKRTT